jgi:hypothetical protein
MAHENLQLSKPRGPIPRWLVPPWLRTSGFCYHRNADHWIGNSGLQVVGRGQEFLADVGDLAEPKA